LGFCAIALASCSLYDSSLLATDGNAHGGMGAMGAAPGAGGGANGSGASAGTDGGAGTDGRAGTDSGTGTGGSAGTGGAATSGTGGMAETAGMTGAAGEGGQGCAGGDCCPNDPNKTEPGVCGCGVAEAPCLALKNSLLHRYSFSGTGTTVTDSKGTAHGTVKGKGAALSGNGTLVLAGGVLPITSDPGQYVELPANCLTGLSNVTFEAWIAWKPGTDSSTYQSYWQRVFDFGETATVTTGSYIMLTPRAANATGPSRTTMSAGMGAMSETPIVNGAKLNAATLHFTVVVDQTSSLISLYVNGALSAAGTFTTPLSTIKSSNCWLGRSQYANDPYFSGTFDEFRVYSTALSAADIAFSHSMGPNPAFF
jgi:hypothetical protein